MRKITLDKDDGDNRLSSYNWNGILQTINSGMIILTDEAREQINDFIIEIANKPENRYPMKYAGKKE